MQSSSDRDFYIKIMPENIAEGQEHNFEKYNLNRIYNFKVPYDLSSIMQYPSNAFSKDGSPTMIRKVSIWFAYSLISLKYFYFYKL